MMTPSIFNYKDYKSYLAAVLEKRGRGAKSRLALALGCHVAYVSQVLGGSGDFSPEQAWAAKSHLSIPSEEAEFFMLLVQRDRAATADLRAYWDRKVDKARLDHDRIRNQIDFKKTLGASEQSVYYSSWIYSAIHVLLTIPSLRSPEKLAERLNLPLSQINEALEFLISVGLVSRQRGAFIAGEVSLHVGDDSPMMRLQHEHWRIRAIHSLDHFTRDDLHYSSIISLSENDVPKVRKILVEAIRQVREVVKPSPEEVAYCYLLDLFPL